MPVEAASPQRQPFVSRYVMMPPHGGIPSPPDDRQHALAVKIVPHNCWDQSTRTRMPQVVQVARECSRLSECAPSLCGLESGVGLG